MDEENKVDPIRSDQFYADSSCWTLGTEPYFFASDRERSVLSEFGWTLPPHNAAEPCGRDACDSYRIDLPEISQPEPEPEEPTRTRSSRTEVLAVSNPSVSSSSSEDPPEKSTASGGKPPPETV